MSSVCSCVPVSIVNCPVLEYLSALALTATYIREANENRLPRTCHFIPLFTFLPSILVTVRPRLRASRAYALFRGVAVGFVCGCMSFIVDAGDISGYLFYSGPGSATSSFYIRSIWYMEMLHTFVLLACLLWTVIHLCEQSSCLGRIPLAVGGAVVGEVVILFSLAVLGRLHMTADEAKAFITLFVIIFLLTMIPCMQNHQRAVIVAWLSIFLNFLWQTSKWDKNVWNWSSIRFPVPGGIAGYMLVMLTSEPKEAPLSFESCDKFHRSSGDHKHFTCKGCSQSRLKEWASSKLFTTISKATLHLWQRLQGYSMFLAFVAVCCSLRISLSLAQHPYYPADRLASCVILIVSFLTMQLKLLDQLFTCSAVTLMALCQLFFYICWTFASRYPLNCYAVDTALGLILVFATRKAMASLEKNSKTKDTHLLNHLPA